MAPYALLYILYGLARPKESCTTFMHYNIILYLSLRRLTAPSPRCNAVSTMQHRRPSRYVPHPPPLPAPDHGGYPLPPTAPPMLSAG